MDMKIKKFLTTIFSALLFLILSENTVFAAQLKVKFKLDGVTCLSLSSEAEAIPKRQKGVQSSEVDMVDSSVTVILDDTVISIDNLKAIFKKEGFPVIEEPLIIK